MENIISQNNKLRKNNKILVQNKKDYDLFFKKFKIDTYNNIKKLKEKYLYLINNVNSKLELLQKNNTMIKEKSAYVKLIPSMMKMKIRESIK